jgi:hypothetical protein
VALNWEINSYAYHLRDDPAGSIADLAAAHRAAALRPRPSVRAVGAPTG